VVNVYNPVKNSWGSSMLDSLQHWVTSTRVLHCNAWLMADAPTLVLSSCPSLPGTTDPNWAWGWKSTDHMAWKSLSTSDICPQ
jgi:hypothetical protein